VKGLEAGETYTWSVRSAEGDADACAGEAVDAFSYSELTARRHGHSKARSRSREFAAADGATYAVVVTAADGTDVACGEFQTKAQRKAERRASKAKGKDKAHGKGKHEASDDDESAGDDEQSDDSDDAADDADSADEDGGADAGDDD
jgi:hypothetical protein